MKKSSMGTSLVITATVTMLLTTPFLALSADKLVIKDPNGVGVVRATDNGELMVSSRLGVGTTSPEEVLHIVGQHLTFKIQDSLNATPNAGFFSNWTDYANFSINRHPGSGQFVNPNKAGAQFSIFGKNSDSGFIFYTAATNGVVPSEKVRINKNGYVGIGKTNPTHLLDVSDGITTAYCDGFQWVDGSSRAFKTNIKQLNRNDAFSTLMELNPVTFNYKNKPEEDMSVGFIAEDVPEMVATKDRKGLTALDITAVLTKVVQEQQKTIAELQKKLSEIETNMVLKQDKHMIVSRLAL